MIGEIHFSGEISSDFRLLMKWNGKKGPISLITSCTSCHSNKRDEWLMIAPNFQNQQYANGPLSRTTQFVGWFACDLDLSLTLAFPNSAWLSVRVRTQNGAVKNELSRRLSTGIIFYTNRIAVLKISLIEWKPINYDSQAGGKRWK